MTRFRSTVHTLLVTLVLGVLVLTHPLVVSAQSNTNTPQLPQYSGVEQSIKDFLCTPSEDNLGTPLIQCINKVYRFSVAFGAIALVFFIVLAGYYYIVQGSEAGKTNAKTVLKNAFVGIAIILGSYVLLSFINPDLVKFKPIQPPIFTASLPKCEDIGFGRDCVLPGGQVIRVGGGGGVSYGGRTCSPITNNASPASVDNLTQSCFGQYGAEVVKQASIVASRESGGNPALPVSAGSCGGGRVARCTGGEIPVWGLYQINLTVHKVAGLNCPAAFNQAWTCSRSCTVTNQGLYNQCVEAAKNAANNINVACSIYQRNKAAGRPGFNDWGNVANEHGKKCGF